MWVLCQLPPGLTVINKACLRTRTRAAACRSGIYVRYRVCAAAHGSPWIGAPPAARLHGARAHDSSSSCNHVLGCSRLTVLQE